MKKTTVFLCVFFLLFQCASAQSILSETAKSAVSEVSLPQVSSIGGDWLILGLVRSEESDLEPYYQMYYQSVLRTVKEKQGVLNARKNTEYARVILTLSALGENSKNVAGYDLVKPLLDYDKTVSQGINGAVWALIALNSQTGYAEEKVCEQYLNYILQSELPSGGFALSQTEMDVDITAMALCALARYQDRESVRSVITRGLAVLSERQNESGGFPNCGIESSESTAQVIIALASLGISLEDERFCKNGNGLMENLLSYRVPTGGFSHIKNGIRNQMATEQALCALCATWRFEHGKTTIFDMRDAKKILQSADDFGLLGRNKDVKKPSRLFMHKTFADISGKSCQNSVETLATYGIVQGVAEDAYFPERTMTRAEFAAVLVRALGLETIQNAPFTDVTEEEDWFYASVNAAYYYGIVKGTTENVFCPYGTITREEVAVMIARAAKLCGMDVEMESFAAQTILVEFIDYVTVSDWAKLQVAFCYREKILDRSAWEIEPKKAATRAEVAEMLYQMLHGAKML